MKCSVCGKEATCLMEVVNGHTNVRYYMARCNEHIRPLKYEGECYGLKVLKK